MDIGATRIKRPTACSSLRDHRHRSLLIMENALFVLLLLCLSSPTIGAGVAPRIALTTASTTTTTVTTVTGTAAAADDLNLIYNTYNEIRLVRVNSTNGIVHQETLAQGLLEGTAIDYYYAKQLICWADWAKEKIECMWMNGTRGSGAPARKEVVITTKNKAEGLAIDWYAENIYWTNSDSNRIEVVTINGKFRKVLFWTDLDQPRGIALIPHRRMMVWSDWGESPKIEGASMDGNPNTRHTLVNDEIFWPNGLTVDLEGDTIYWVDGKLHVLRSIKWDGTQRRTIVENLSYPHSVTLWRKRIFWTDWQLHSLNTLVDGKVKQLLNNNPSPIAVRIYDSRLQPMLSENPCQVNNGNCSHLCLLAQNTEGYTCGCPTGVKLLTPHQCTDRPQDMLFLLQRTQISRASLDTPDYTSFPMSLGKIKYAIAIDYDPVEDMIYWSDGDTHSIMRSPHEGGAVEVLVTNIKNADGVAVDWLARNLYWTNTQLDRIEVSRLDGSSRRVIINDNLHEPRAIAVAPTLGWMFWSDWSDKMPKVERASLDGSERVVLVSSDIGWPNGITLDVAEQMLYWCDAKTDKIEVIRMDGSNRQVVLSDNLPHAFGLSLLDDYIYWSDWQRRSIDRAHKRTGTDRTVIVDQHPDLMGIKVARLSELNGASPCQVNNGGCSHLCLNKPQDYVCLCPIEYELAKDRRTCILPDAFLFYGKSNTIGRISVELSDGNYNDFVLPSKEVREIRELDVDVRDGRIYWSDPKTKSIARAFVNGSDAERIVDSGLIRPEGLAIDWMSRNVYWSDTETKRIEVARLDGTSRKVLLWKGIEDPTHLVLNPRKGFMYWSEQQLDFIMRAEMDGSDPIKLVKKANNIGGMTIDLEQQRLYWTSQASGRIEWADCEGQKKGTTLIELESKDLATITVYGPYIYWSDWNTGDIERVNKVTGLQREVVHRHLQYVSSLVTFGGQGGATGCTRNNGVCSHLCLPVPSGYRCACPTHYTLNSDGLTCTAPKSFLIFSQRNSFGRLMSNASGDAPNAPLPVQGKNIRVIEYDPIGAIFFWIDGKTIRRSSDDSSKTSIIINVGSQPFDLAYDVIGKLLFWTCSHTNSINITSIDGEPKGHIETGDSKAPRNLAIDFMKRYLFWTDYEQQAIFRAKLDGSLRIMVISQLAGVSAVAVDPQANMVFYADGKRIERIDYDGNNKKNIVSININQVTSLAALNGQLYWLDEKMTVESIGYNGEGRRPEMLPPKQPITDIAAVWFADPKVLRNHTCLSKRVHCSHFCLANPANLSESAALCACPPHLVLLDDGRNCGAEPPACGPTFFMCSSPVSEDLTGAWHKDCIPASWRCDGQSDCADRSDEEGCPACHDDQFRCQSGECIDRGLVCDGTTHCQGGDDEVGCCKSAQEFKCPRNNVCIPPSYLCDGWENCADGADESDEICQRLNGGAGGGGGSGSGRPLVQSSDKKTFIIVIVVLMLIAFFAAYIFQICRTRLMTNITMPSPDDQAAAPLSPLQNKTARGVQSSSRFSSIPDVVWMSTLIDRNNRNNRNSSNSNNNGGSMTHNSYDRNNITGASSSSAATTKGSNSLLGYPPPLLNPPPSPATTTATSTRCNSYHRPYRHYRSINQPPPPTPCSTDVCDESDSIYTSSRAAIAPPASSKAGSSSTKSSTGRQHLHRGAIDQGSESDSYPTPARHHHHQHYAHSSSDGMMMMTALVDDDDARCPPSSPRTPSNFSPLPPPPSPVLSSPRGY